MVGGKVHIVKTMKCGILYLEGWDQAIIHTANMPRNWFYVHIGGVATERYCTAKQKLNALAKYLNRMHKGQNYNCCNRKMCHILNTQF